MVRTEDEKRRKMLYMFDVTAGSWIWAYSHSMAITKEAEFTSNILAICTEEQIRHGEYYV